VDILGYLGNLLFSSFLWNPDNLFFSIVGWATCAYTILAWAVPAMNDPTNKLFNVIKNRQILISICLVVICLIMGSYSIHTQEQSNASEALSKAKERIDQLTFERDIAVKQNEPNSVSDTASSIFSLDVRYAKVHQIILKDGVYYLKDLPDHPGLHKLLGSTNDKALLVILVDCGIIPSKNIQSILLEIGDKPAFSVWETNQRIGIGQTIALYIEYMSHGVIEGKYDARIIAVADNKSYYSQPFTFEIPAQ
jgi:hypothetical protein